jgi:glycosyltransferase involved in cell wall biosynthesis
MTYKSQTVSAIVITENNAATLERALSSLQWVDELLVFDRGSTDGTLAIARGFTEKVFFHPSSNLTILRRDALSTATCDWLLLLEPDEWIEEMLKHEIDGVMLNTPANLNGYTVPRKLKFQNQWIHGRVGEEPERALRLVRKKQWEVVENWDASLKVGGDVGRLDRPLGYAPYSTVEALFAGMNTHSTLAAYRHLEEYGVRPSDQSLSTLICQTKCTLFGQYWLRGGFLKGYLGFTFCMANTMEIFLKYAKVRALTGKK